MHEPSSLSSNLGAVPVKFNILLVQDLMMLLSQDVSIRYPLSTYHCGDHSLEGPEPAQPVE